MEAPRAPTAVVASDTAPKKLTPLLEQLQAGERQQVLDALSASGKLSAAARAALPEIIDQLFVQQHEQAQRAAIADWLYEVVWRRSTESPIARGEAPGSLDVPEQLARRHDSPALPAAPPFLIFTDAGGLGEACYRSYRRPAESLFLVASTHLLTIPCASHSRAAFPFYILCRRCSTAAPRRLSCGW